MKWFLKPQQQLNSIQLLGLRNDFTLCFWDYKKMEFASNGFDY